jgi:hypothetical protein
MTTPTTFSPAGARRIGEAVRRVEGMPVDARGRKRPPLPPQAKRKTTLVSLIDDLGNGFYAAREIRPLPGGGGFELVPGGRQWGGPGGNLPPVFDLWGREGYAVPLTDGYSPAFVWQQQSDEGPAWLVDVGGIGFQNPTDWITVNLIPPTPPDPEEPGSGEPFWRFRIDHILVGDLGELPITTYNLGLGTIKVDEAGHVHEVNPTGAVNFGGDDWIDVDAEGANVQISHVGPVEPYSDNPTLKAEPHNGTGHVLTPVVLGVDERGHVGSVADDQSTITVTDENVKATAADTSPGPLGDKVTGDLWVVPSPDGSVVSFEHQPAGGGVNQTERASRNFITGGKLTFEQWNIRRDARGHIVEHQGADDLEVSGDGDHIEISGPQGNVAIRHIGPTSPANTVTVEGTGDASGSGVLQFDDRGHYAGGDSTISIDVQFPEPGDDPDNPPSGQSSLTVITGATLTSEGIEFTRAKIVGFFNVVGAAPITLATEDCEDEP